MLNTICNYIVLAAAVVTALITIFRCVAKLIGKPIVFFRKQKEKEENRLKGEIAQVVSAKVMEEINPRLDEITSQNETLIEGQRDSLRHFIVSIYRRHKKDRRITETEKEALEEFYSDYKKINGNHYIDRVYQRMEDWPVVPDDEIEVE